ncbi:hypothetical protein JOL62DRAFT_603846 [Phyllosticta paracitricarpa]|uniref:Uncharacterized protein n=1 Tax=Phyllosticta paracitricarpa TaxID=2016321 RepID=A0ABR1N708_9PEZI
MATSNGSDHVDTDGILQQFQAGNVDIATFLDEKLKPREPPNPSNPTWYLRVGQPDTRIIEPLAPSGGNSGGRKRAAESPAQRGARPAKKKVADKSTSNGKASSKANAGEVRGSEQQQRDRPRTIITHLKDVPQPLRETLKTLTNFKKGAKAPSPDLAHVFHGQQSDSELYRLFTQAFICYDVSAYDGDKTDFYLRLLGHAYTHYLFRHIADQAIENW